MKDSVVKVLNRLDTEDFTNNVQSVLFELLVALDDGEGWVHREEFVTPSATSRIRDLRLSRYGNFDVKCRRSDEGYEYKLGQRNLSVSKLRHVFSGI